MMDLTVFESVVVVLAATLWVVFSPRTPLTVAPRKWSAAEKRAAMSVTMDHFPCSPIAEMRRLAFSPSAADTLTPDTFARIHQAAMDAEPCIHPGVFAVDNHTARYCHHCHVYVPAAEL